MLLFLVVISRIIYFQQVMDDQCHETLEFSDDDLDWVRISCYFWKKHLNIVDNLKILMVLKFNALVTYSVIRH